MSIFIPGDHVVENTRALAWSALPDAPVVPDDPRPKRLRRLLRRLAGLRHGPSRPSRRTATSGALPARLRTVPSDRSVTCGQGG
jgi:hypothetical protein